MERPDALRISRMTSTRFGLSMISFIRITIRSSRVMSSETSAKPYVIWSLSPENFSMKESSQSRLVKSLQASLVTEVNLKTPKERQSSRLQVPHQESKTKSTEALEVKILPSLATTTKKSSELTAMTLIRRLNQPPLKQSGRKRNPKNQWILIQAPIQMTPTLQIQTSLKNTLKRIKRSRRHNLKLSKHSHRFKM